jgi:N-acyl-L-homoserine lactone synthetase
MMSTLRSYYEREIITVNSPKCLTQFRNIHRQGDQIGGEGRAKDDRVIALAIAVIAWNDWIMREMQATHRTFEKESRPLEIQRETTPVERGVLDFLRRQGISMKGVTNVK